MLNLKVKKISYEHYPVLLQYNDCKRLQLPSILSIYCVFPTLLSAIQNFPLLHRSEMASSLAVGLNKGFPVTKLESKARPSHGKARISKRTRMVRELVGEVVGMAPYEKRLLDMLKTGGASAEKRIYKFAKRRLGGHKRAQKKRDQTKATAAKLRARG